MVHRFVGLSTLLFCELFDLRKVDVDRCRDLLFGSPFSRLRHCISLRTSPLKDIDRLQALLLIQLARDGETATKLVLELGQSVIIVDTRVLDLVVKRHKRVGLPDISQELQIIPILLGKEGLVLDA